MALARRQRSLKAWGKQKNLPPALKKKIIASKMKKNKKKKK